MESIIPMQNIFLIIMMISTNYFTPLYQCDLQNTMANNMYAKHFFAYLTMVFFVTTNTISSQIKGEVRVEHLFLYSIIPYIFFVIISKTSSYVFIPTLILLSFCYLLSLYKSKIETSTTLNDNKKKDILFDIDYYNNVFTNYIIVIVIVGFLYEIYSKKNKLENFNLLNFIVGNINCK